MHESSIQIPIKKGQRFADALGRKDGEIVAARFSGALFDLSSISPSDGTFEAVNVHSKDGMKILRHSAAHLMAQATLQIYPDARLNAGPPTEDGFYYDIMMDPISSEDLGNIEKVILRFFLPHYWYIFLCQLLHAILRVDIDCFECTIGSRNLG